MVQPVSGVGLVTLAVFSHFYLKETLQQGEWNAVAVAMLGTVGLGASADDGKPPAPVSMVRIAAALLAMVALLGKHFEGNARLALARGVRSCAVEPSPHLSCNTVSSDAVRVNGSQVCQTRSCMCCGTGVASAVHYGHRGRHRSSSGVRAEAAAGAYLFGLQAGCCFGLSAAACRTGGHQQCCADLSTPVVRVPKPVANI